MKKYLQTTLRAGLLLTCFEIQAQTLVPATSEDIEQFDRQLAEQAKRQQAEPAGRVSAQFGEEVANEAKKLKDASLDQRKEFGKKIRDQRRSSEAGRSSDPANGGTQVIIDRDDAASASQGRGNSGKRK